MREQLVDASVAFASHSRCPSMANADGHVRPAVNSSGCEKPTSITSNNSGAVDVATGVSRPLTIGYYEVERTLGKGNFAVVKLARHVITKSKVAIKIIDKTKLDCSSLLKMNREIRILKALRHPHIIALYQVMETDKMLYVVSEYVENGELFDYITKHGRFREPEARRKFVQVLRAVEFCHSRNVVHRDLKVENLLLDANLNIKLADFGFGTVYQSGQLLNTWCGSPPYAAPEMFLGKEYLAEAVDVWSLGVVLYVMLCGFLPFDAPTLPQLKERVLCGRFQIPFFMSCECEQLIKRMLTQDPKRRARLQEVRNSKWLQAVSSDCESPLATPTCDVQQPATQKIDGTASAHSAALSSTLDTRLCDIRLQQNEQVLKLMQLLSISREKTLDSLRNDKYDDYTAVYLMLCERVRQHRNSMPSSSAAQLATSSGVTRRPSAVADQTIQASAIQQVSEPIEPMLQTSSNEEPSACTYECASSSASSASTAATTTSGRGTTRYSTCESSSLDGESLVLDPVSSGSDVAVDPSPAALQPVSSNLFSTQIFNSYTLLSLLSNASHFNACNAVQARTDSSVCVGVQRSGPYPVRRYTVTSDARVRHALAEAEAETQAVQVQRNVHGKQSGSRKCHAGRRISADSIAQQQQHHRRLLLPHNDRRLPGLGDESAESEGVASDSQHVAMECELQSAARNTNGLRLTVETACANLHLATHSPYSSMTSAMQNLTFAAPIAVPVAIPAVPINVLPVISVSPPTVDTCQSASSARMHPQDVAYDYYAHRDRAVSYSYGQNAVNAVTAVGVAIRPDDIPLVSVFALRNRRIARHSQDDPLHNCANTQLSLREEPHDEAASMVQ